jgi:hypothetical protein
MRKGYWVSGKPRWWQKKGGNKTADKSGQVTIQLQVKYTAFPSLPKKRPKRGQFSTFDILGQSNFTLSIVEN